MRLARSLIVIATLLTVLTVAPASARAGGAFTAHSHGNPNVDIDFSGTCPNLPPRFLVARFFGVFNGGNARVVELRIFNNTDRAVELIRETRIRGNATIKDEYIGEIPPRGSVVKYPNVTHDSPIVTVYTWPWVGFGHPAGGCGQTDLVVRP